jgi:hypothetical protein
MSKSTEPIKTMKAKKENSYIYHIVDNKKCGQVIVERYGYQQMPIGFGFRGKDFVVDYIKYPIYKGYCLGCLKKGYFRTGPYKIKTKKVDLSK